MDIVQSSNRVVNSFPPLNNITPFTRVDGWSFLEVLEGLRYYVTQVLARDIDKFIDEARESIELNKQEYIRLLNEAKAEIEASNNEFKVLIQSIVDSINNRAGNLDIQRIPLVADYALIIKPSWPNNLPIEFVFTQDAVGGHRVIGDENIANEIIVDPAPNGITEITLWPLGNGEWIARPRDYVNALQWSIKHNTSMNADAFLKSAESAVAQGKPLHLPTNSVINMTKFVMLPENLVLYTNGAKFTIDEPYGSAAFTVQGGSTIYGDINIEVKGGNVRGIYFRGNNISAGNVSVISREPNAGYDPATQIGDSYDQAITLEGVTNSSFGRLYAKNFDYPIAVKNSVNNVIERVDFEAYLRGLYIQNSKELTVKGGHGKTRSSSSDASAGENTILIGADANDATMDLKIQNFVAEDAGEHGIRIGSTGIRIRNVHFTNITVRRAFGCGLKILGGSTANPSYHEDITVNGLLVEDCRGAVSETEIANTASAGIMLQFVRRAEINGLIVRRRANASSVGVGVHLQACEFVNVVEPIIQDTAHTGIYMSFVLGNMTGIRINGGSISSANGDGIFIDYTNRQFRRIMVVNYPNIQVGGYSLKTKNSGTGDVVGGSLLTWWSANAGDKQIHPESISSMVPFQCDVYSGFPADDSVLAFRNGSKWTEPSGGTIRHRASSQWLKISYQV